MDNSFGSTGSAARIKDKERVFCIHDFCRAVGIHVCHRLIEIDLHFAMEFDRGALFPAQDDDVLDSRGIDDGLFNHVLERDRLSPPDRHIGCDHDLRPCTHDPLVEGGRAIPAKNDGMNRPDPGTREHRDHLFGNDRHVDADPVPFCHAQFFEAVCKPLHFAVQLAVGKDPLLVGQLALPDQRHLVAPVAQHVPVEAVIRDVGLAVHEPFCGTGSSTR